MNFDGFISYSHAADGRLAPAVQRGLHRLAKPWHHRRALWIFRDQTGLSVTPALWSSIQKALDGSEWFVLLASPEAARSPWVNREIEHWIATKPADRILPVVTDGEWRWDPDRGDLSADSTAVPDALRGVFAEEPLFLDLRWAHDDRQLNLRHTPFRDAIAQLAAPMHGISKDELDSEDVRQHRRVRRLRRVAVAAVASLTLVAALTGVLAGHNADRATASAMEAQHQQQVASQQRDNAERSAVEARRQEEKARTQETRARAAAVETKRQEKHAREQQGAAERAAAEAEQQEANARRQQQLAKRAQSLAEQQQAVAQEQSKLAEQSATETKRQRIIAEQQQRLATEAAAEAERQKNVARQQQRMAEDAAAEAGRQKFIARENERKAKEAAEEARRQEENAAQQKQITLGRKLVNQAKATINNDPATALKLGIAARQIQPGAEAGRELSGLVTSTRQVGAATGVLYLAYGPNGLIAAVESDYTASLWSVSHRATPVRLAQFEGREYVGRPVFTPDGKTVALMAGRTYEPMLFDVSDPAKPVKVATVPSPDAGWLTFSPDGRMLAAVNLDEEWSLWDTTVREKPVLLTQQNKGPRSAVTFSPDGRTLVSPGAPGTVWDITDPTRPTALATLGGDWRHATFSPKSPLLTTIDNNENVVIWNLTNRTKPLMTSPHASRAVNATYSPDGLTLATSDSGGTARLWDMAGGTPTHLADLNDHGGHAETMAFSPDGRTLATAGYTGMLSLWTVEAHGEPKIRGRAVGNYDSALMAAHTPDGKHLITASPAGTATVWDLSNPAGPVEGVTARIHPAAVDLAVVSPGGDLIAAVGKWRDDTVSLTDLSDPSTPVSLGKLPGGPYDKAMAFGPDGRTLAVGTGFDVALWDLTDRRHPVRLADLTGNDLNAAVAYSPDGRTVAVATLDRAVNLWNVADRAQPVHLGTIKGHSDRVVAMRFSPDGRTLATGSTDKTVALWNVADPARRSRQAILAGNDAPVWSVSFAPDGRTLAIGTEDNAAALWDVADPSAPVRVAKLRRADLTSESLLFHPDGRTLTGSGKSSGSTRAVLWDYSSLNDLRTAPAALACAVAGGGFTPDEWAAYIPEAPYQRTCD
ncbi:TIR domain-containing protein [Actinoplanes sp. NEAU-A12]|uniref:TIR domain-containing protein n=1 Tax=Actinoplanes sandaracinus TaxID=3045177 RepID=A0ABT6WTS2_9ACTN|nr:TIR domain-containing protein [Actinoplanes sandaracinus]MDI6103143.1 TIR domain-containing protein [Actinoplanes sandaracinus]